jgi:hypothetical protein
MLQAPLLYKSIIKNKQGGKTMNTMTIPILLRPGGYGGQVGEM